MIYPDTSFWIALRIKGELHHEGQHLLHAVRQAACQYRGLGLRF